MKNRGSVTIFCCLMVTGLVVLGLTAISAVRYRLAEAKGAIAVRSAMSGVDGGYNRYIFDNYHILLFDKNCNGRGEAYMEEQLIRDVQHNLGEGYDVEEIGVRDFQLILDNECSAFTEQINDYCGYALLQGGAESVLDSTGGKDGTVSDSIYQDMEAAENETEPEVAGEEEDADILDAIDTDDPRDFTKDLSSEGVLIMVVPEDMNVSTREIDLSKVPSWEKKYGPTDDYETDRDFDDLDVLRYDIGEFDSWKNSLVNGGTELIYAANVFNCATEVVQEETVFSLELEYLICGKSSDKENLKGVVHRIIGVRMPVNYAYLVGDVKRMSEIKALSVPLSLISFLPEPVVRYLIAGCWAYVESIVDVRGLLDGQRLDFFKTDATWKTDLNNLEDCINLKGQESESGLCYKDYLIILLAMNPQSSKYRMLDIIELNAGQYYRDFDINNGAVAFSVDAHISFCGKAYYYSETMGY